MTSLLISILMMLGYINSPSDASNATDVQIQEAQQIIINDTMAV